MLRRQLPAACARSSAASENWTSFSASAKVAGETGGPTSGLVPKAGGAPGVAGVPATGAPGCASRLQAAVTAASALKNIRRVRNIIIEIVTPQGTVYSGIPLMRRFVTFFAFLVSAHADILLLRGKVVMADGSVPPATVAIERICAGGKPQRQALTDRKGEFVWRALDDRITANQAIATDLLNSNGVSSWLEGAKSASNACILRASLTGYESNSFDLGQLGWTSNPDLPPLTLYRKGEA